MERASRTPTANPIRMGRLFSNMFMVFSLSQERVFAWGEAVALRNLARAARRVPRRRLGARGEIVCALPDKEGECPKAQVGPIQRLIQRGYRHLTLPQRDRS